MARIDSDHHLSSVDETKQMEVHQKMPQGILTNSQQQTSPTRSSTTQHLAVLYQSHHHHHLHSVLSGIRRQSRLPDIRATLHQYQDVKA